MAIALAKTHLIISTVSLVYLDGIFAASKLSFKKTGEDVEAVNSALMELKFETRSSNEHVCLSFCGGKVKDKGVFKFDRKTSKCQCFWAELILDFEKEKKIETDVNIVYYLDSKFKPFFLLDALEWNCANKGGDYCRDQFRLGCNDTEEGFLCVGCPHGTLRTGNSSKPGQCEDIDECESEPCNGTGAQCINYFGSFECTCINENHYYDTIGCFEPTTTLQPTTSTAVATTMTVMAETTTTMTEPSTTATPTTTTESTTTGRCWGKGERCGGHQYTGPSDVKCCEGYECIQKTNQIHECHFP